MGWKSRVPRKKRRIGPIRAPRPKDPAPVVRVVAKPSRSAARLDAMVAAAGYGSYHQYLGSNHWKAIKLRFKAAWHLARCVGCRNPRYQLHHTTYDRIGAELLSDFIPLCQKCHSAVHDAHREHKIPLADYESALCKALRWSARDVMLAMMEYRAKICR